ncbi:MULTISPECIES: thioredoxin domain-containing protein [Arthrobacter]|uniref:Thioredoxin domain-containing protein n=2 Tax=Arthrobacter TaxID=1663 RepID=A0ABU9KLK5_9MICC|nr:thioredoxin domain-containing protein [Arthrobacter sp. YJM1]MDP5227786.1 thioredoxin domain-containing protein [Arthrobacter sp. YJM1]
MTPAQEPRQSKAERTAQAREKARLIREQQLKKEKRNKLLLIWGVVVAAVLVVGIVVWSIMATNAANAPIPNQGATPANANVHGGAVLTKDGVLAQPGSQVDAASIPTPTAVPSQGAVAAAPSVAAEAGKPVKVVAYVDFICPVCKNFESTYGSLLDQHVKDGSITVEYRPIGLLDAHSTTNYSSRAAAAAACVLNVSPEKYQDYFKALYAQQPDENGPGLTNDKLSSIAKDVGAKDISQCVNDKTFRPFVLAVTKEAASVGVNGTPTVFVDGKQYGAGADAQTDFPTLLNNALAAKAKK